MKRVVASVLVLLGAAMFAHAQDQDQGLVTKSAPPPIQDTDTSSYHQALLNFKSGHYEEARTAIDAAETATPADPRTEILKARILTELHDFSGAKTALESLNGGPALTPEMEFNRVSVFGDLCLRKRDFSGAVKFFGHLLTLRPKDPDVTLKLVYASIGSSDLVAAGNYASQLSPIDPKNPYDDHASYYFAKAALDQATGNSQGADDDIQQARTIYGITITNRYLKTYLEFTTPGKNSNPDVTPAPLSPPK